LNVKSCMNLDSLDPRLFDRFAKLSGQTRRRLVALSRRHGRGRAFERSALALLEDVEPELAARLQSAAVYAYLGSAAGIVREIPKSLPALTSVPPVIPPKPPTRSLALPSPEEEKSPWVFPQVRAALKHVETRIAFTKPEYDQLGADSQRLAFTVARLQTESAVRAVQNAVREDIENGGTLADFSETIADHVAGSGLGDSSIETIYRTHVGRAYSAGQVSVLQSPAVQSAFPYLEYSATHDSRVRPDHLSMESLGLDKTAIYRADDRIWDTFYPPWAWNCRCMVIPLSVEDAAARGVREAIEWLRTGRPPTTPEYVTIPPFRLPSGWSPVGRRISPVQ
jgi:SPP1 gp7 family putative phage head morphogenesis protein